MFDRSEFLNRVSKTKQAMKHRGMDVLISTNPANMNYLSGYDGYSFYVIQGLVLALDIEEPCWIGRQMDRIGAEFSTWLKPVNILGYGDDYVQSDLKHPMHFFADVLKEKGLSTKKIGLEMGQDSLNAASYFELQKMLPDSRLVDASFLVNQVRMVKSEQEIACMKLAGKVTANGMKTAAASIAEGVSESAAAAKIYGTLIEGTDGHSGDYPAIIPLISAGEQIAAPHLSWSNRKFNKKEMVSIELSGCINRYHAPLARTFFLGSPPQEYLDTANVVLEGLYEMLNTIKAGVTCGEVANKWSKAIAGSGIQKDSRVGYPVGIGYPPDWGEQTASFRTGETTLLKENMTFHVLPALFEKDSGFVVSETIRVTKNGCELLADLPNSLVVI